MAADGLRFFIEHVKSLKSRTAVGEDGFEEEYKKLKAKTDKYKQSPAYASDAGKIPVNKKKNRYKDILPYDHSRVELPILEGVEASDYINASYVKGASGDIAYVAAQGPLPATVADFWRMVWCLGVKVIIMVCNEVEMGKPKCKRYWPGPDEVLNMNGIIISEAVPTAAVSKDFLVRNMVAEYDGEQLPVTQFHYTAWPDHGVPDTVDPILEMVELMRDAQAGDHPPIVVHCSAGCGRTGAVCAIDYISSLIKNKSVSPKFSLSTLVCEMRQQRMAMVQTKDQYVMVYKAVLKLVKNELSKRQSVQQSARKVPLPPDKPVAANVKAKSDQASSVYENVDFLKPGKPAVALKPSVVSKDRRVSYENTDLLGNSLVADKEKAGNGSKHPSVLSTSSVQSVQSVQRELADFETEELMTTDIDAFEMSSESAWADPNEGNEPMSDDEFAPPVPARTAESNQLLLAQENVSAGGPVYGNLPSAGSLNKFRRHANVNEQQQQQSNYSGFNRAIGSEFPDSYGTLSRDNAPTNSHEYSKFTTSSTDKSRHTEYDTVATTPTSRTSQSKDIDYDVVSAIVSELKMSQDETYNVVGEDSSKATSTNLRGNGLSGKETPYNKLDRENVTEGPYAVVTTNKLYALTSEAQPIVKARSESPKVFGSSPGVSLPSPNPMFSTLPKNTGNLSNSVPPPSEPSSGKKLKNFFIKRNKPSKQPKPSVTKLDIAPPAGFGTQPTDLGPPSITPTLQSVGLYKPTVIVSDDPLGFPNRVDKPRGPRPPPSHWNCKRGV